MNDIKIKFHLFQNKCTISVNDLPLPRYSSLNNYVNRPLLDMASILMQTLSDELNDEFSLTVTGTQFEQKFLADLQETHSDCVSFKVEEFGVGGELKDRYNRTLQDVAALSASIGNEHKEKVFSEVDLNVDARLAETVSAAREATLCVANSPESAKQMLRTSAGQLVLCVSEKTKVVCLNGNQYIWCVRQDEIADAVTAVVEHFAIPRYINRVAEFAKNNENSGVAEVINNQKRIDVSIVVNMDRTALEGDYIIPQFKCLEKDTVCPKIRIESANQNVIQVEGNKLLAIREGKAEIRFYRDNEIDAFEVIPVVIRPDNLVKAISLEVPQKIKTGNKYSIDAKYVPANAPDIATAVWSSDNKRVVEVYDDGTFKALSEGRATITVKTERASESIEITVIPSLDKIDLSESKLQMFIGEKKRIKVSLSPSGSLNEEIRAKSSNPKVAEISQNDLGDWIVQAKGIEANGKGKGVCRIVFTSEDGKCQSTCEVTVASTMERTRKKQAFLTRTALFTVFAFVLQFFTKPIGYYGGMGCAAIAVLLGVLGIIKTKKQVFWQILLIIISALIFAVNFLLMTEA